MPLPSGQSTPAEPPTEDELTAVLKAAIDDALWVLWLTLLGLGLRKGEALGMRWSRIDLDAGTVRIRKQILREREAPTEKGGRRRGRLVEVDTKTPDSKATMLIPAALVEALTAHRKAQRRARLAARVWVDPDLVFTTGVGTALEPRNVEVVELNLEDAFIEYTRGPRRALPLFEGDDTDDQVSRDQGAA